MILVMLTERDGRHAAINAEHIVSIKEGGDGTYIRTMYETYCIPQAFSDVIQMLGTGMQSHDAHQSAHTTLN